jgi:nitrite reductase (NADH) small subunit
MEVDTMTESWSAVCALEDIIPNTGVCALVQGRQIAVFRVRAKEPGGPDGLYAIDNFDPNSRANVLSRGLIGSIGERVVVASPIYKQHFDLKNGECLEAPQHSVKAYSVRLDAGKILVAL